MARELEDNWQRVNACLSEVDATVVDLVKRSYWFGVTTGVAVFTKAIDGEYR